MKNSVKEFGKIDAAVAHLVATYGLSRSEILKIWGRYKDEPLRVEELEEGREAVRVTVVRGGAQEEAVLESRGDVSDDVGDLRVDGVPARSSRSGDVGLVEDEQALRGTIADVLEERVSVLGPPQDLMRDDETWCACSTGSRRSRAPGAAVR